MCWPALGATEQVPVHKNTADPSSRPNKGTGGTDTGAPCSHNKIPGGLEGTYLTPACGDTCRLLQAASLACNDHMCSFPCEPTS